MVTDIHLPVHLQILIQDPVLSERMNRLTVGLGLPVLQPGVNLLASRLILSDQPGYYPDSPVKAPVRILIVSANPPLQVNSGDKLIYDWIRPDCPDEEIRFRLARTVAELRQENQFQEELTSSRRSEEKFRKTLQATPDAIVIVDAGGKISFVNDQAEHLFGYTADQMIGQTMEMLLPTEIRGSHPGMRDKFVAHPKTRPMGAGLDLWCQHQSGRKIPVEVSLSPVKTDDGLQIASAIRDISQRKEADSQLHQAMDEAKSANRAKSEFLANMSHELRTPLNAILGYSQILQKDRNLNSQQRDGIDIIRKSGEHLLTLINDILDLSKIESGYMELHEFDFDFGEFLEAVADVARIRCREKGISFLFEKLSDLPKAVHSDEKKLRQVLFNLLSNAVKFTDEGGVAFKVGYHEGKIRFQVEDTGVGIPADRMGELFLPFHQVGDKVRHVEGTGLGLAISQRLSVMLGGEIQVRSSLGSGSTFWVELDLKPVTGFTARTSVDENHIIGYLGERKRVLIVDDKWENRSVLVHMLSPIGFDIQEAKDGLECLNKCVSYRPDIIFIDLRMPKMDGFEVTRRIRKTRNMQDVVIIAVSASVFEHNREDSLMAGCDEFVAKPFQMSRILGVIQDHLGMEWIYENQTVNGYSEVSSGEHLAIHLPENLAGPLLDLARMGDVEAIIDLTLTMDSADPGQDLLAREIQRLVKSFDLVRLEKLATERRWPLET
ncbi:MAG: PAS domain S-box protein [Bacteroidetes bacterium]|nr:PAS domain S-box protein [Bacteroidota bacterium]